jgi:hypothetical protein
VGEYFIVANFGKEQFLNPWKIPSSERFPSIITNSYMSTAIAWLVCGSNSSWYNQVKKRGFYLRKYLGSWYGDKLDIVGDSDEEDLYGSIRNEFQDITIEVFAMLLEERDYWFEELIEEAKKDSYYFTPLAEVGLLEHCASHITFQLASHFGKEWKETYYNSKCY